MILHVSVRQPNGKRKIVVCDENNKPVGPITFIPGDYDGTEDFIANWLQENPTGEVQRDATEWETAN